jgi:recombination protein RecT
MNTPAKNQAATLYSELREELRQHKTELAELLPSDIAASRFIRVCAWCIQATPRLAQCSTASIIAACLRAATDGLLPDGREGAFVAYEIERPDGRRELTCQWLPMIMGIRKKVHKSGLFGWTVQVVQMGDYFDVELGAHPFLKHKPAMRGGRDRQVIAAYSIATFADGTQSIEVMNVDQLEDIKKRSRARHGPWNDKIYYPEMCRKTVARLHSKQLPMTSDIVALFQRDDATYGASDVPTQRIPPPKSTRAALSTFAPADTEAKSEEGTPEPINETPPKQVNETEAASPKQQPSKSDKPERQPKNVDEYWRYFIRKRDAATSRETLQAWFHSDQERHLRTICQIGFEELDRLKANLAEHAAGMQN